MNWHKLIANIIYLIYMVVTFITLLLGVHYFKTEHIASSFFFAGCATIYIFVTMQAVYWLMPASIRVYWHDDSPK